MVSCAVAAAQYSNQSQAAGLTIMFRIIFRIFLFILIFYPASVFSASGLPWSSSFETGNLSEWNGYMAGSVQISAQDPQSGSYCVRIPLSAGTLNDNYLEHYFGDHARTGLDRVEEVYLQFHSKFSPGYTWPARQSHKLALLNLTDPVNGQRKYQVYVYVTSDGQYAVDYSHIDSWRFFGLAQNVGEPVSARFSEWDGLKLYVKLNTPGELDGIVKLWVNGTLKLDHRNLDLRENTSFNMNKLILSSYTSNQSGSDGVQWSDNWALSENDPEGIRPNSPVNLRVQ